MNRKSLDRSVQDRPLLLMRLQQNAEMQQRYVAQLPWWRHPLVGYLLSIPLTALSLLVPFGERQFIGHVYFLGAPCFLVTVLVALFWGGGPAIFSIVLGVLALDYFFLPPLNSFTFNVWGSVLPILPYLIAECIVALITAQRETARRRALFAEQSLQLHNVDLEAVNAELEQANRLKDLFFSRASHELKTPLTAIRGHAQIGLRRLAKLQSPTEETAAVRAALEKIDDQTHHLHVLIDDLLDLGMLSAGKMKLRFKRCNLNDVCRDIVEEQCALTERSIQLVIPPASLMVRADCDRLGQVLLNLLTNALKYSPDESTVQVSLQQQDGDALIKVHNEGTPISREQQEHIFEPFYRTPSAHSSTKQGWGLGLAICKDIVEHHHGRIWVESSSGAGTTFCVAIPRS